MRACSGEYRGINFAVSQRLFRYRQSRLCLPALRFGKPDLRFRFFDSRSCGLMIFLGYAAASQQVVGSFFFSSRMLRGHLRVIQPRLGNRQNSRGLII